MPKDIYAYWSRLKNGRRFPSRHDLDAPCIALHWPNALLLTCRSAHAHAEREIAITGATRFGDAMVSPDGSGGEIVVTPAITEWILAIGREAARVAAPLQDQESFPLAAGNVAYGIVALPLSDDQNEIDHVLCHIRHT